MSQSLHAVVDESLVEKWIEDIGKDTSASVPLLQKIQEQYGYLPQKAMDLVVAKTEVTASQLYGVATFYSQFRLEPVGRHIIKVCHGTACHVRGADRLETSIRYLLNLDKKRDTTESGGYTVEEVACVGCCSQAPVMVIDGSIHGDLTGFSVKSVVKKHAKTCNEEI